MIIDMKHKKLFAIHVSRDEMLMLEQALQCYGGKWDKDDAWEASYQIRKMLESSRITFAEMCAEEERLKRLDQPR